ncbi:hypothetical protein DZK27_06105 [Rhodobacteraceae bacterium 63075]|nr:hypothetical protein DZK27_06105 [Rhodobacteraceae bacterium 63075]
MKKHIIAIALVSAFSAGSASADGKEPNPEVRVSEATVAGGSMGSGGGYMPIVLMILLLAAAAAD